MVCPHLLPPGAKCFVFMLCKAVAPPSHPGGATLSRGRYSDQIVDAPPANRSVVSSNVHVPWVQSSDSSAAPVWGEGQEKKHKLRFNNEISRLNNVWTWCGVFCPTGGKGVEPNFAWMQFMKCSKYLFGEGLLSVWRNVFTEKRK